MADVTFVTEPLRIIWMPKNSRPSLRAAWAIIAVKPTCPRPSTTELGQMCGLSICARSYQPRYLYISNIMSHYVHPA